MRKIWTSKLASIAILAIALPGLYGQAAAQSSAPLRIPQTQGPLSASRHLTAPRYGSL